MFNQSVPILFSVTVKSLSNDLEPSHPFAWKIRLYNHAAPRQKTFSLSPLLHLINLYNIASNACWIKEYQSFLLVTFGSNHQVHHCQSWKKVCLVCVCVQNPITTRELVFSCLSLQTSKISFLLAYTDIGLQVIIIGHPWLHSLGIIRVKED